MKLSNIIGMLLFVTACHASSALAFAWEGAVITCGDHWLRTTIDVSWPESVLTFSGDSTPLMRSLRASTLVMKDSVDGRPVLDFYFQALDGVDVELAIRSYDGRSGSGVLSHDGGLKDSVDCLIRMPVIN